MVVVGDRPVHHDIKMVGAGRLTGLVRAGELGIGGVMVVLTDAHGEVVGSRTINEQGRYAFAGLVDGSYA